MKVKIGPLVCRVCLQSKSDGIHLQELLDKFQSITNKKVSMNDGLSLKLCPACVEALNSAYNFKLQCEKSENHMKKFIENINNKLGQVNKIIAAPTNPIKNTTNECTSVIDKTIEQIFKEPKIEESTADSSSNTFDNNYDHDDDNNIDDNNENVEFLDESICSNDDDDDEDAQNNISDSSPINVSNNDINDPLTNKKKKVSKKKKMTEKKSIRKKINKSSPDKSNENIQCEQCHECFSTKSNLIRHVRTQHTDFRKMYQCHLCEIQVTTYSGLKMHIKCRHLNLREYKCDYCSKAFNQKKTLASHLMQHSYIRIYVCDKCGKGFSDQRRLNYHLNAHDNDNGCKYQCEYCSVYFKSKIGKFLHERNQHNIDGTTIYPCSKCDKHFESKNELVEHRQEHIGERPFKCNQCDRDFVRESMLIYHQKQHSRDDLPSLHTLNLAQRRMYLSVDKYENPVPPVRNSHSSKRKRQKMEDLCLEN